MARPIITIPKPSDPKYGFLSISSSHSFTIEEKSWPSITHFILAKQFEGTILEDEIRQAKNVTLAGVMAKQRSIISSEDGRLVKRTVYGLDKSYQNRADWNHIRLSYLRTAIKAKFDQNPRLKRKLLDTTGMEIVDLGVPEVGKILTDIREEYGDATRISALEGEKRYLSLDFPPVDLKTGTLTPSEEKILSTVIHVFGWIKDMEGLPSGDPGMFEDAVTNIIPSEYLVKSLNDWIGMISREWSVVIQKLPRFENVVRIMETKIGGLESSGLTKTQILQASIFIATFLRWMRMNADAKTLTMILEKCEKMRKRDAIIPPIPKPYRKDLPLKVSKRPKKVLPGTEIFSLKGLVSDPRRVKMSETSKGKIMVRCKALPKYIPQLLALGGKPRGEKVIEIPRRSRVSAEAIFFNDLPTESKMKQAYRLWRARKMEILIDTAQQLARLTGAKSITSKIMGIVVNDIYSFPPRTFTPTTVLGDVELTSGMHNVSPKVLEVMAPVITLSVECAGAKEANYQEYFDTFDRECGWIRERKTSVLSKNFSSSQIDILRSLKNIIESVTDPRKGIAYPLSIETASWALLTLCPKHKRNGCEEYIKRIFHSYPSGEDRHRVEKHLSSLKTYSKLNLIMDVLSLTKHTLPLVVLTVMAAALTFFPIGNSSRSKELEERALLMRGVDEEKNSIKEIEIEMEVAPELSDVPVRKGEIIMDPAMTLQDGKWIIVIANASSTGKVSPKTSSEMVTDHVYTTYPYANVYESSIHRKPGDAIISIPKDVSTKLDLASTPKHRYIATLIAERSAGGPKKIEDTIDNRKKWFAEALSSIVRSMDKQDSITVASSSLAPEGYQGLLEEFAISEGYTFYIVDPSSERSFGVRRPKKVDMSPSGEKISPIPEDVLNDEIARGIFYTETFAPHGLSPTDYSKLITHLERCIPKTRKIWLEDFVTSTRERRDAELTTLLDRLE